MDPAALAFFAASMNRTSSADINSRRKIEKYTNVPNLTTASIDSGSNLLSNLLEDAIASAECKSIKV